MNRNRLRTACIGSAAILIGINHGAWISSLVPEEVRMLLVGTGYGIFLCLFCCVHLPASGVVGGVQGA